MPATDYRQEARVRFEAAQLPEFADLYARVREAVGEEAWADVTRLLELSQRYGHDRERRVVYGMIDGIARHFPGQAPAIRAVGRHVLEDGNPSECGGVGAGQYPSESSRTSASGWSPPRRPAKPPDRSSFRMERRRPGTRLHRVTASRGGLHWRASPCRTWTRSTPITAPGPPAPSAGSGSTTRPAPRRWWSRRSCPRTRGPRSPPCSRSWPPASWPATCRSGPGRSGRSSGSSTTRPGPGGRGETFDLVTFAHYRPRQELRGGRWRLLLGDPTWRRLTREQAEVLAGEPID